MKKTKHLTFIQIHIYNKYKKAYSVIVLILIQSTTLTSESSQQKIPMKSRIQFHQLY